MNIIWSLKSFNDLTPHELYAILQLRNEIFVVEQKCIFQDADNKDQVSYHLMGWDNDVLAAYTRLVPANISFKEISIGRVVTSSQFRNAGLGKELMKQSIDSIWKLWNKQPIRIGAQLYLKSFYESLGFEQVSDVYLEDDIEHIEMLLAV
jgi:ElaA protein